MSSPSPVLHPLRDADHTRVLRAALDVRADGGVPLIGDERWSDAHWRDLVAAIRSNGLPKSAAWATFTSGSTGRPRAVLRSARSWEISFPTIDEALGVVTGDEILIPVHPVSSMALYAAAHAESRGLDFTTTAGSRLRAADLTGPSLMHGTPTHLRDLVTLLEGGARSTLGSILIGGAGVDAELAARTRDLGLRLVTYFGAAELSLVALDHGDGLRAMKGVELEIRDHVLWVRTEQLALGTAGAGGSLQVRHGWATVGDRASLSHNGVLHLHGRADDAILTAGATVVPADVEVWLESIDGVNAALVYGESTPSLGQLVVACVELTPGTRLDRRSLEAQARTSLAPAQRPRRWLFVAQLPRTASGKVRRLSPDQAADLQPFQDLAGAHADQTLSEGVRE